jgi:hypothetical protein
VNTERTTHPPPPTYHRSSSSASRFRNVADLTAAASSALSLSSSSLARPPPYRHTARHDNQRHSQGHVCECVDERRTIMHTAPSCWSAVTPDARTHVNECTHSYTNVTTIHAPRRVARRVCTRVRMSPRLFCAPAAWRRPNVAMPPSTYACAVVCSGRARTHTTRTWNCKSGPRASTLRVHARTHHTSHITHHTKRTRQRIASMTCQVPTAPAHAAHNTSRFV